MLLIPACTDEHIKHLIHQKTLKQTRNRRRTARDPMDAPSKALEKFTKPCKTIIATPGKRPMRPPNHMKNPGSLAVEARRCDQGGDGIGKLTSYNLPGSQEHLRLMLLLLLHGAAGFWTLGLRAHLHPKPKSCNCTASYFGNSRTRGAPKLHEGEACYLTSCCATRGPHFHRWCCVHPTCRADHLSRSRTNCSLEVGCLHGLYTKQQRLISEKATC